MIGLDIHFCYGVIFGLKYQLFLTMIFEVLFSLIKWGELTLCIYKDEITCKLLAHGCHAVVF